MTMRLKPAIAILLAITLLAGCAAEMRYREGKELIAQGKIEESLPKFQAALDEAPNNPEYRIAYRKGQERYLVDLLDQADKAKLAGNASEAEALYKKVLVTDGSNLRAKTGLESFAKEKRLTTWMQQANELWAKDDAQGALVKVRAVLAEDTQHVAALALKRAISDKIDKPATEPQLATALKKPLSIEFKDAPLKQIFEVLSRTSGLNFVFDRDVRTDTRSTVFLRDTTIESAVNLVLMTNQLEQRVLDKNTILIYPPQKARDYQALTVKTFFIANADVKQAANTIRTILKTRDIVVDEKQNLIIMRDTPEAVRLAEKLMAVQDAPEPEVMLEIEILEVKRSSLLDLGVSWPSQISLTPLSRSTLGATTGGATTGSALTVDDLRHLSRSTLGVNDMTTSIKAHRENSDANILANPRIRVRNREKARILVGDRVPSISSTATSTGFVSESVQYIDVGLKLEVEPTIFVDDEIAIKIQLEVSNIVKTLPPTKSGTTAYQIGTRNANTTLRLKDGENQVLAGLISDEDRKTSGRIPGLGDLPLFDHLFGSNQTDKVKTEIILSITPRLIRNTKRPELSASEFDSGTEASVKARDSSIGGAAGQAQRGGQSSVPMIRGIPFTRPQDGSTPTPPATPTPNVNQPGTVPGIPNLPPNIPGLPPNFPGFTPPENLADPQSSTNPTPTSGPTAPGPTILAWNGPSQVKTGSNFDVVLAVETDQSIASVPITVGYDPKKLQVVSVNEGNFLKQGGVATTFTNSVDAVAGRIEVSTARASGGATSSGTLTSLTLRGLAPAADTQVALLSAAPTGITGNNILAALPAPKSITVIP